MTRRCERCGGEFRRLRGLSHARWAAQRYCSRTCSNRAKGDRERGSWEIRDCGYETPCWIWTGGLNEHGYGKASVENRTVLAHRMVYEQEVGPIPDGLDLDHLCEIRACVNPLHVEPVTTGENTARSWRRGRHQRQRGARAGRSARMFE
jgi:hypothetical protein